MADLAGGCMEERQKQTCSDLSQPLIGDVVRFTQSRGFSQWRLETRVDVRANNPRANNPREQNREKGKKGKRDKGEN